MLYEVITGIHVNQKVVAQFLDLFAVDPPPSGKQSLNLDAWQEAIDFLSWHKMFMLMQYLDIMDRQRSGICLFGKCLFIHYRICEI